MRSLCSSLCVQESATTSLSLGQAIFPGEQTELGVVDAAWGPPFPPYVLSYARYRATCRSGNHRSLHPGGYCEHLEEKAGCGCQFSHLDKLPQ